MVEDMPKTVVVFFLGCFIMIVFIHCIFHFMEDQEKAGKIAAYIIVFLHIVGFLYCIFFGEGEGVKLNELYPPKAYPPSYRPY